MSYMILADTVSGLIHKSPPKRRDRRVRTKKYHLFEEPANFAASEEELWRAVIVQAIQDATCNSRKPECEIHRMEAIRWLTRSFEDFEDVCIRAGLDPNYVRVRAKKAFANPKSWRTAFGKSEKYRARKSRRTQRKRREQKRREQEAASHALGCLIFNLFAKEKVYGV